MLRYKNQAIMGLYLGTMAMKEAYSAGEKRFSKENFGLPEGFRMAECLKTTGTAYINMNLQGTVYTRLEVDAAMYGPYGQLAGCYNPSGNSLSLFPTVQSSSYQSRFGAKLYGVLKCSSGVRHVFAIDRKGLYLDNTTVRSWSSTSFSTGKSMYLGFVNGGSSRQTFHIYGASVLDNGKLVRQFVPCVDKNGTPLFYDLVGKKSYYNIGSGKFSAV